MPNQGNEGGSKKGQKNPHITTLVQNVTQNRTQALASPLKRQKVSPKGQTKGTENEKRTRSERRLNRNDERKEGNDSYNEASTTKTQPSVTKAMVTEQKNPQQKEGSIFSTTKVSTSSKTSQPVSRRGTSLKRKSPQKTVVPPFIQKKGEPKRKLKAKHEGQRTLTLGREPAQLRSPQKGNSRKAIRRVLTTLRTTGQDPYQY